MNILSDIRSIDRQKWHALVQSSPCASPFQLPEFYDFYNSVDNQRADVFAVEKGGAYTALVVVTVQQERGLKAYFSRRAIVYGGVLLSKDVKDAALSLLLNKLADYYSREVVYLEFRNSFDYSIYGSVFLANNYDYLPWLNIKLSISTPQAFYGGMTSARKRQLNNAIDRGVTWRESSSLTELQDFYTILSELYSKKVKKPLPSFQFFEKFVHTTFAKCLLVMKDDQVIGGVICPIMPDQTLYEYYICGLDKHYPQCHPSVMAMWAMAEYASQHNIPVVDLMGAAQPDTSSSVRDFKTKFGGEIVEHGRFILKFKPLLYGLGSFYLKLKSVF